MIMALSGSMHGSSSMHSTEENYTLDQNFGNEKFSPEFEAYMSTNIGKNQISNCDNFYMNGLYTTMNVAKTNYSIKASGKTAIFAICRGEGGGEDAFEASRRVLEYLDSRRNDILNAGSLSGIKKNLRKFGTDCNEMLIRDKLHNSPVSMIVVVYAFSQAVFMSSGVCSIFRIGKKGRLSPLNTASECMGVKSAHSFEVKDIKYLFNSDLMLSTENVSVICGGDDRLLSVHGISSKERVTSFMDNLLNCIPERNHTCIAVHENGKNTITPATKITAAVCAMVTAVSLVYMLVQCL